MIISTSALSSDKQGNHSPSKKQLTDEQLKEALKYISSEERNITAIRFQVPQPNLQGRKSQSLPPSISLKISRE